MTKTKIEWADRTWNPVTGCTKVSPGCDGCYAETIANRFKGTEAFPRGFEVTLRPEKLHEPLRWRKPSRVFVDSMFDPFHEDIPRHYLAKMFAVMAATPNQTYLLLTKRHGPMRSVLNDPEWWKLVRTHESVLPGAENRELPPFPLPNVWLGVSVEDQPRADLRIPALLETPAAVRFLSCEPLLGPVDLKSAVWTQGSERGHGRTASYVHSGGCCTKFHGIDLVIAGGESGPQARPMHPAWVRALRDQCIAAEVPFFFKQWGEHVPVPVEDDPQMVGGRSFRHPEGGRCALSILEPGRRAARRMEVGERNGFGVLMDEDTLAARVGKKKAGRELDGELWEQFPNRP